MHHKRIRRAFVCAASGGVLAVATLAPSAGAAVIAHWRFEPGAFTADSSPSGAHPLVNGAGGNAATPSADVSGPAAGAGSALFDGDDFLRTASSLDLTPYRQLRVSWLHRKQGDATGIVFEHTGNYNNNPGAFINVVNGDVLGRNDRGYVSLRTGNGGGYSLDDYPHAVASLDVWEAFSAEINLDAASPSGTVRVFDGAGNEIGSDNAGFQSAPPAAFVNDLFSIGSRGGAAGFVGNIDELKIEEVPEPAGLTLLGFGALCLAPRRRR